MSAYNSNNTSAAAARLVSLANALSCINRLIQDNTTEHTRTAAVYKNINSAKDPSEVKSPKDTVLLAQVCSGHCLWFKAYRHLLVAAINPSCQRCGKAHTHWNTGSWNVPEPRQHEWRFLVTQTRCWMH